MQDGESGQQEHQSSGHTDGDTVPPDILSQAVARACRTRHDGFIVQIPANVGGQFRRRAIAASTILLQRLHRDPVKIAAQQAHQLFGLGAARFSGRGRGIPIRANLGAGAQRFVLAQLSEQLVERPVLILFRVERRQARQQHVEHDPQRVHVGARVNVLHVGIGLLRTHVSGRPHKMSQLREQGLSGILRRGRLRQSEVDDPRHRFAVHFHHQNVCRLQIAMDDGLLMRVLHAFAGLDEKFKPIPDLELLLIAILRNRQPGHVLHHEVRLALWRRPSVKHLGDGGMIHDRQRLPLRLEALHDRLVVHPSLDQLQGNLPPHGRVLFGQPDLSHAAFTKLADELKALGKDLPGFQGIHRVRAWQRRLQKAGADALVGQQKRLQFGA